MHTEHPRWWSPPVVKFLASNVYGGLTTQDHTINTFSMSSELKNSISRNYQLSTLVPAAVPETRGRRLEMVKKKVNVEDPGVGRIRLDNNSESQTEHTCGQTRSEEQPLEQCKTAGPEDTGTWAG